MNKTATNVIGGKVRPDALKRSESHQSKAAPRRRRRPLLSITTRIDSRRYLVISTVAFVIFALLWWGITAAEVVKPMFLPSPERVWQRLTGLAAGGQLWDDLGISLFRISFSFGIACAMAIPLGMLIGSFRVLDAAFEPMIDFIRYMPVVAFVPLTILWVGTNELQKYLIIWLGTFFQLTLMVQDCVKRVPRDFIDVGRTLEMREWSILQRIVLPSSAPAIWDAMRICLGWAWSWLVLAELVAASAGMGYRITVAQRYFQTDTIIGYVLVLGMLGLASDQLMKLLGKYMFRYQERS